MGPILNTIYVAPLFDITNFSNFAADNFALSFNSNKQTAISDMENKLKLITKWLKDSGLKVNEIKIELCLFYRKDTPLVELSLKNTL